LVIGLFTNFTPTWDLIIYLLPLPKILANPELFLKENKKLGKKFSLGNLLIPKGTIYYTIRGIGFFNCFLNIGKN